MKKKKKCEGCGEFMWDGEGCSEAETRRSERDRKRLKKAILWALGMSSEFRQRENGEGAYWWRKELRYRAGIALKR